MKKELILLFAICIILTAFVSAEDNVSSNITTEGAFNSITEATDSLVDTNFYIQDLPPSLISTVKVFTKFEDQITLSHLIIFILLTILIYIIFENMMASFSPFSKNTSVLVGILITLILGALGAINGATNFLINSTEKIKFFAENSTGALLFLTTAIIILWILFTRISNYARRKKAIEEGKEEGFEAGTTLGSMKYFMEGLSNIFKRD